MRKLTSYFTYFEMSELSFKPAHRADLEIQSLRVGVVWSNSTNLQMDVYMQVCVWVSALLYEVVYGQVSVHHTNTCRVQSSVLQAAVKGVFLVSCVCVAVVTNSLPLSSCKVW